MWERGCVYEQVNVDLVIHLQHETYLTHSKQNMGRCADKAKLCWSENSSV